MASAWELMAGGGTPQNSCEGITEQLLHTLLLSLCVPHTRAATQSTTQTKKPWLSFFPDLFLLFLPQREGLQLKPSSDSSSRTLKMHLSGTTSLAEHSKGTLESQSIRTHPRPAARTRCQHCQAGRMQQGLGPGMQQRWERRRSFSWDFLFLEQLGPSCCWAA